MFDIDKELNEIKNINIPPPIALVAKTKKMVDRRLKHKRIEKKIAAKKRIIKFTSLTALPVAAAILLAIVISVGIPKPAAYFSMDIGTNVTITTDKNYSVRSIEYDDDSSLNDTNTQNLKGESIEYAVSQIIIAANGSGHINENQNLLIACFGADEYNNISLNQVLSFLNDDLKESINLLSVSSGMDDWKNAKKLAFSPSLYALSNLSDNTSINKYNTLNELIEHIENTEKMNIAEFLELHAEPVIYSAPELVYSIKGEYVIFSWDYVNYKKHNYDGYITYQLVSSDTESGLTSAPAIDDIYTFAVWEAQPVDYTMLYENKARRKYYAVIAVYDDGTRAMSDKYVYLP